MRCLIHHRIAVLSAVIVTGLVLTTLIHAQDDPSPKDLDAYIHNGDESFRWELVGKAKDADGTNFVLNMTSQTWHDIVWKHTMYVIDPANLTNPEHCILFISGGRIGDGPRQAEMTAANYLADLSGMSVAVIWQVPNQPLFGNHTEDSLIGETFLKTIETKDTTWPLLFPMTKSAVRAMDTVQELFKKERGRDVKGFVVFGASKRGWTTWLTAAAKDSRVVAIAPVVINILNMPLQTEYQMSNWGYYSEQIGDYSRRNLLSVQDDSADPEENAFRAGLWRIIDPYSYRSRVTIPKLLVHGTNDRYWNLDATKFYWDDLVGPKYLLTLPNVGHNLDAEMLKGMTTFAAFAKRVCSGDPLPTMTWNMETGENAYTLTVTSDIPAMGAKLWVAREEGRDFREAKWSSTRLTPFASGEGHTGTPASNTVLATVPKPETGYVAFYVELETEYEGILCSLTTEVFHP